MSTFSGLNTAYTGLIAARQGLDTVGQNIANATTQGYTRQRVATSAAGPVAQTGPLSGAIRPGQGVSVDTIARLGSLQLDARVRSSAAAAGYSAVRANALTELEGMLQEPGTNGLSARLQEFWAAWQGVSNQPGETAPATVLLGEAGSLAAQIAQGYRAVDAQWTEARADVDVKVAELNGAAAQVADLNARIRSTLAAGGPANELLDQRGALTATIAALAGGTVRESADGTIDVLIGGNAIVSGTSFRTVQATGARSLQDAADVVRLSWADAPGPGGSPVVPDGGELAGALSLLGPAAAGTATGGSATGTGGAIAEAAAFYNRFATDLTAQVNTVHRQGVTPSGASGQDFFAIAPGSAPAALNLTVVPADVAGIATAASGAGPLNGTVADRISQLGVGTDSPDKQWSAFVTGIGVATKTAMQQGALTDLAATSAANAQLANASVDLDEENVNLLSYQHAYQGAARVLTAVDEMLDTLINHTGLVGR